MHVLGSAVYFSFQNMLHFDFQQNFISRVLYETVKNKVAVVIVSSVVFVYVHFLCFVNIRSCLKTSSKKLFLGTSYIVLKCDSINYYLIKKKCGKYRFQKKVLFTQMFHVYLMYISFYQIVEALINVLLNNKTKHFLNQK